MQQSVLLCIRRAAAHQPHHGPHGRHQKGEYHHHHHPVFCSSPCAVCAVAAPFSTRGITTAVGAAVTEGWSSTAAFNAMSGSAILAASIGRREGGRPLAFAARPHSLRVCTLFMVRRDDAAPRRLRVRSLPIPTPRHHHIATHSPWFAFRQQQNLQVDRDHAGMRGLPPHGAPRTV